MSKHRSPVAVLLGTVVFSLFIFSSGTLELFKDGGARDQGVINRVEYHGILNYVSSGWCLLAAGSLLLFAYSRGRINISRGKIPLALSLFAALSCLWSPDIIAAMKSAVLVMLGTFAIIILCTEKDSESALRFLAYALIPLVAGSAFAILFMPSYGISVGTHDGAWQGLLDHKNGLGSYCALSLCIFLGWRTAGGPLWLYVPAAACLVLTIGSQSMTSSVAAVLVLLVHFFGSSSLTRASLARSAPMIMSIAAAIPIMITAIPVFGGGFEIAGKGALFSGRGYIWSYLLEGVFKNPLLGNGFNAYKNSVYSGSNDGAIFAAIGFLPGSAHNGFLESAHSMGLIGLALSMALIVAPVIYARRSPYFLLTFYVSICALVINTFESRLVAFNSFFFVLCYIFCLASRQRSDKYE